MERARRTKIPEDRGFLVYSKSNVGKYQKKFFTPGFTLPQPAKRMRKMYREVNKVDCGGLGKRN